MYSLHKQIFEKDEYNFLVFSVKVFILYPLHSVPIFNVRLNLVVDCKKSCGLHVVLIRGI